MSSDRPGALRAAAARAFVSAYRTATRGYAKAFSLAAAGAYAEFGRRSVIQPPVRLKGESRMSVGSDVFVGAGSWLQTLEGEGYAGVLRIGDGTSIAGTCVLSAACSVTLGRKVLLARNVYVSDHIHRYDDPGAAILDQGLARLEPVEICDGAWLGQNVVVCPGVRIGRGAVVGANAVVTTDIPDRALAVGAPARVVRVLDEVPEPSVSR